MKIAQKTKNKFKQAGLSIALSILFVYALVHPGYIQPLELAAYDFLLAKTLSPRSTNQHVLVLGQTEADIRRFGHPLSDQFFAELIEKLNVAGAITIGFDKLRDIPIAPGSKLLNKTLKKNKHVMWIYQFGSNIPPPAILKDSPQAGFSDLTQDPDSTVRRSLLMMRKDKKLQYAFPLLIALNYLYIKKKITLARNPKIKGGVMLGNNPLYQISEDSGGYNKIDARGYQILINYSDAPQLMETYSLTDFYDGKINPANIKGKAVLVGGRAPSLMDYKQIPIALSNAPVKGIYKTIFGVDVHAFIVNQLIKTGLNELANIQLVSGLYKYSWLTLWLLLALLVSFFASRQVLVVSLILGTATIFISGWVALYNGWWLITISPLIGWLLTLGFNLAYTLYEEKKQKNIIMSLFSRHVPSGVADLIMEQQDDLIDGQMIKPQTIQATIMFTDIKGFTTISEHIPPVELLTWLNEYMFEMSNSIQNHQGIVNQYLGDGIMAVFGAPIPSETAEAIKQDALNAVNSCKAMDKALVELNKRWQREGKPVIKIRAGIFSGPVVRGSIGSRDRSEFCIIGNTVNTSARLEAWGSQLADTDSNITIIVGESTAKFITGHSEHELIEVGALALKGKADKVVAYHIKSD